MAQPHYGDQEARRAVADVDHDHFAANIQGEGYGVLGDDNDMSFNSAPTMYSEPPIEVHPQRKDPLTAGKASPVVISAGYEPAFEAKPADVGEGFPPASAYGNVEDEQYDAVRAVPPSDYGGQSDEVTKFKDVKGYTSLGIEESQGSENSTGVLSEEGNNSVKEKEGTAPNESMAKELEDYPVGGGYIADVPPLKKDFVDFSEADTDDIRGREAAPKGFLRNTERQQEDREGGPQGSFGNALREQEEREGAPRKAVGINKDESVEIGGGGPHQTAMAEESEGGSAIGSRGIIDLHSLKGDHVDTSETSPQEPNVIDDSMEGDSKEESKADDSISETGHTDASHFTPQIKSPVNDAQQRYAVDDPTEKFSVDNTKQEFPRPDSSKQEDFSEISQEPRTDDSRKEDLSISGPKPECPVDLQQGESLDDFNQEDSLDVKEKSPVNPIHEDSIAGHTHAMDAEMEGREAAPQAGLLGNAEQQEDQREGNPQRSFEKEQGERDVTSLGALKTSKDKHLQREGAASAPAAEEPEGGSATGSRGVIDVQSLKENHVHFSEASPKEPNSADDPTAGTSTNEPIPRQAAIAAEEPEGDSAPGSRGIIDVDSSEASTKKPNLVEDSMEGNSTKEPTPPQSTITKEPEGDSAPGSRGILDAQSLKEAYGDLSGADTKEPIPADDSMEGSITNEPTPRQSAIAEEPEGGSATESRGIMDVQSLKEDHVDLSEASTKEEPNVADDFLGVNSESAVAEEPEGVGSVEGSRGIIDVQSVKEDYVDTPEKASGFDIQENEQARDFDTSKEHEEPFIEHGNSALEQDAGYKLDVKDVNIEDASLGDNAVNLPAEEVARKFSVEEHEQEDLGEVAKPESALDDAQQSKQAQASPTDDARGSEHLQGDDGKEKIKAEGYDIFSGEPKSTVYDVADVIGDEHEKPTHETEADEAVKPYVEELSARNEALPEALGIMKDVPKDSGSDLQEYEQGRNLDTREEHDVHAEPFTQHVSSAAVEQDVGLKLDDRDVNAADVSTREEAENVPADKKALEFPAADLEQDESAEADATPEFVLDDAKQPKPAEVCPTGDDVDGCEHFQGDDGREKIKLEGYNIYSGEPEKAVYVVADVIGDQHEKLPHETEETRADAALKPSEGGETKDKAAPGVGEMEDVLKKVGGFDIQGNEQPSDTDTSKEHDEHVEPATQHISPAMEQDAGFKPDARDTDIEDASMREGVLADRKSPYTDVFKIESSDIQQGLGFEPNLKDREEFSPAATNKEEDAPDRKNRESGLAGEEFPNTEFAHTDNYVKVGHAAESFVPKHNEEVGREVRAPSERVDLQQEERRPTHEHPLDKPRELDNVAEQEETYDIEEPKRPPTLPHPEREDIAEAMNNRTGDRGEDEQQHHEAGPQKKGIVAKIKEKLSHTSASH